MAQIDNTYHHLLQTVLDDGFTYEDPNRKGINRIQIPSYQFKHDFKDGFPAITTKKLYWKGVVAELLWILRGDTNIKYLVDNNINIWNKDAYNYDVKKGNKFAVDDYLTNIKHGFRKDLNLGDIDRGYGAQLRNWTKHSMKSANDGRFGMKIINEPIDQLADIIHTLKNNPMATKKTVTFWNPAEKEQCALTPCHWSFEILVEPLSLEERIDLITDDQRLTAFATGKELFNENNNIPKYQFTLKWHQHSVDTFLGLPFNIASYALLAHIIGKLTGMIPKGIIGDLSNVHIYEPHLDAVKEQLSRDVNKYGGCELNWLCEPNQIDDVTNEVIDLMKIKHFQLKNYKSYPRIPAEMLAYSK